jgi:hypothetical protein
VKNFIAKNATPTSDSDKLTEQACRACDKSPVAEGIADYNYKLTTMPLNANKDESIKFSRDFCPDRFESYAFAAIEDKQFEIKKGIEAPAPPLTPKWTSPRNAAADKRPRGRLSHYHEP